MNRGIEGLLLSEAINALGKFKVVERLNTKTPESHKDWLTIPSLLILVTSTT